MMIIRVNGIPAPQGSKRHVGGGRMVESSAAVGPWREAIRSEIQDALEGGEHGFPEGPVTVFATFYLKRSQGHYGTGRNSHLLKPSAPAYPAIRPDLDKLARAVLDAIVMGGAIGDDKQVVTLEVTKLYASLSEPPGVRIGIRVPV